MTLMMQRKNSNGWKLLPLKKPVEKLTTSLIMAALFLFAQATYAAKETYLIDTKGAHASIEFRIKHLGYSGLVGRFDEFEGSFMLDRDDPSKSSVTVDINPASINSNHAERDKHLRDDRFLDVKKFPQAKFVSKRIELTGKETGKIIGDLTLKGVTKEVTIDASLVGGGKDPWGGFRVGFIGTTKLTLADFDITYDLGPASTEVELTLNVEGIRQ